MPFPSFASSAAGPESEATVKWFNAEKGYGFVALSDGSGDVFLHINTLQAAGVQTVSPGATLRIRVGQGQKGKQVDQVVSVDESTAAATPARRPGGFQQRPQRSFEGGPRRQVDLSTAVEMMGTVKRRPRQGVRLHHAPVGWQGRFCPRDGAGACRPRSVAGGAVGADGRRAGRQGPRSRDDQRGLIKLSRATRTHHPPGAVRGFVACAIARGTAVSSR